MLSWTLIRWPRRTARNDKLVPIGGVTDCLSFNSTQDGLSSPFRKAVCLRMVSRRRDVLHSKLCEDGLYFRPELAALIGGDLLGDRVSCQYYCHMKWATVAAFLLRSGFAST
jgi:hypothetical protein